MKPVIFLFFAVIFAMFYATAEVIYLNVLTYIFKTERSKLIAHVVVHIIGQSFWILLIGRVLEWNKFYDRIFYFCFVLFLYMFFLIFITKIISHFREINMQYWIYGCFAIAFFFTILGHLLPYFPTITKYEVKTNKNVNLKIAFISDVHIGDLMINPYIMQKTINIIKEQNVDFLAIGGDIIEGKPSNFEPYKEIFKNSGIKTFAVLGNHDYYRKSYMEGAREIASGNIDVLMDEYRVIDNLVLIGREDKTNSHRTTIENIIKNAPRDKFFLLLDHNPIVFNEAVENKIDLQLSGHTHNGQFFPFNFIVKAIYEKPYGELKKENSTLITSSGLSGWGPPMKLLSPVEIVVVEISSK